jgi:hypothetical protein
LRAPPIGRGMDVAAEGSDVKQRASGRSESRGPLRRGGTVRPRFAFLAFACGLILDTVTRGRREAKLNAYLALRAPGEERRGS